MGWEAWLTCAVIAASVAVLVRGWASPAVALFAALAALMAATAFTGTTLLLSPAQAVAGFGNTALATVGALFVVVSGLIHTGAVTLLCQPLLARRRGLRGTQTRMLIPIAALSAFLNNTPVVAMSLPMVQDLARRHQLPASRLFLPLSYASILGGTCTLIGTSTNLVVDGMLESRPSAPELALFDLAWIGVPLAVAGLTYIILASPRLLPDRRPPVSAADDPRRYTVEVLVEPGGALVGKSIEEAGLRHLPGLFLMEIERDGELLPAVAPTEHLRASDRLVFVGVLESVVDLHRMRGLTQAERETAKLPTPRTERCLVEAVVSAQCPLIGQSVRAGRVRSEYGAAVVAVARGGERVGGKIGDIVLQAGDTLLLETHTDFLRRQRDSRDFYLVSHVEDSTPRRHERAGVALAILGIMVVAAGSGLLDMLTAALLAAGAMLATHCCTGLEARRNIDWDVLLVIGAALGLGNAMANSGAATAIATGLVGLAGGQPWLVLLAVFAVTSLFTELITNNAAAVLLFPVASAAAGNLGVSVLPYVITLMVAASCSFSTPLGYQTNLMVYGPGGYRFSDYLRFGIPMNLLVMAITVALAPFIWPF